MYYHVLEDITITKVPAYISNKCNGIIYDKDKLHQYTYEL